MNHSDLESPLRIWRKAAGLTQEALAEQADVTQAHISHVENGESPIEGNLAKWLERIAAEIIGLQNQHRAFMQKVKDGRESPIDQEERTSQTRALPTKERGSE